MPPVDPAPVNRDLLDDAWQRVYARGGAAGVDGLDPEMFSLDLSAHLAALERDLLAGVYRPLAYRAVDIPKPSGGTRRIAIAAVRDRVAQTAAMMRMQPLIEPLLHPCCFAYRRGLGVHDALAKVAEYRDRGLTHVLHADIAKFFDRVPHAPLIEQLEAAGVSEYWRLLVANWLAAPIVDRYRAEPTCIGLPQGLPISPALANLYLTPFDRRVVEAGWKLVRYADDFVVCCPSETAASDARLECETALAALSLELNPTKTGVYHFGEGFEFLGARFLDGDLIPAVAHPYEADFRPPPPPPRRTPPAQALPHLLLRTLYVQQQGCTLGCHGGRLVVSRNGKTILDLPAHHVDQVFTFGRIQLTSAAMSTCLARRVPVYLFSGRGQYYGVLRAAGDGHHDLRRAQYRLADDPPRQLAIARTIVAAKVAGAMRVLDAHAHSHAAVVDALPALRDVHVRAAQADALDTLRGVEGSSAALYFRAFAATLQGPLTFTHRSRRPPLDPINSMLSLGYMLLFYNCYSAAAAAGLDPDAGLYHRPAPGHPALVSDLVEEFRAPIVDALVLQLAKAGAFNPGDFYFAPGEPQPCYLRDETRPRFIAAFEEAIATVHTHPDAPGPVDWRRILHLQAARLRRFLLGAIDRYQPFHEEAP